MTTFCETLALIEEKAESKGAGLGHQQMLFYDFGIVFNSWLGFGSQQSSSDNLQGPIWLKSIFRGFVYTNKKSDSRAILEVYKNGTAPVNLIASYTFPASGALRISKSDFNVTVNPVDGIAVYMKEDPGAQTNQRPQEPRVWLFFEKAEDATFGEFVTPTPP